MKRSIWLLVLVLAGACQADDSFELDDRWYLSPTATFGTRFSVDGDDVHNVGGQLAIGKPLSRYFNLELRALGSAFVDGSNVNRIGGGLDLLFFLDRGALAPFLLVGAGGASVGDDRRQGEFLGDAGGGLLYKINDSVSLRTDVRYRVSTDFDDSFNELVFNAGVLLPLGERARPAPPAPVVEAAPEPDPCSFDSDQDGVDNCRDKCPNTAAGIKVDTEGCPIAQVVRLEGVNFEYDSARLTPDSAATLDGVAMTLKDNPQLVIEVAGHTSTEGSERYNLRLSQARAESVVEYLRDHGVQNTLIPRGYGETQPIIPREASEADRTVNRRVELKIEK